MIILNTLRKKRSLIYRPLLYFTIYHTYIIMYHGAMECIVHICRLRARYSRLIEDTRKFLLFWATKSGGSMIQGGAAKTLATARATLAEASWARGARASVCR